MQLWHLNWTLTWMPFYVLIKDSTMCSFVSSLFEASDENVPKQAASIYEAGTRKKDKHPLHNFRWLLGNVKSVQFHNIHKNNAAGIRRNLELYYNEAVTYELPQGAYNS